MPHKSLYLGVLSGTSADGLDIAAVCFTPNPCFVYKRQFAPPLSHDEITRLSADPFGKDAFAADLRTGEIIARAINTFIAHTRLDTECITAIGLHGQTIAHRPDAKPAFSRQLGAPDIVFKQTSIPVVANFRQSDIAVGGQGAPLAPVLHRELFAHLDDKVAVVNIGGIANVTLISRQETPDTSGWDCGPGNILMDAWSALQRKQPYDKNGAWAAGAAPDEAFLQYLMALPFIGCAPPKSACAGDFTINLLRNYEKFDSLDATTVASTLCEWTAACIAHSVQDQYPDRLVVCGGGAFNTSLLDRLRKRVSFPVETSQDHGVPPQWVEAMLFAYLARRRIQECKTDLRAITGAQKPVLLGEIFGGKP